MSDPLPDTEPADVGKIAEHEAAAHQKRNWVRLTFDCNDRCIFCLDSHTHNGTNRANEEVKAQILDGRQKGAERLILSGGEPTIHPNYVDFIRLGTMAGYERIQTVTNGRMFAYRQFLTQCLDAGLGEITFSIHGPNARIHDALVGTKGAFEQEMKGLINALEDGRPIINIDVCVNRGNVKQLPEMLRKFTELGVLEFDLLHVIPFGRAYTEGKETLFYDLEEMRPYLLEAFAYSKRPDVHIWLNRFPPQHLEEYEHLIQDPYKLNDEVRGRKEEYEFLLADGVPLDCRQPHRCSHCYLEPLCDNLDGVRETLAEQSFKILRVDTEWEGHLPPVYGGDPASKQRSESRNQIIQEARASADGRVRLPLAGGMTEIHRPRYIPLPELMEEAGASTIWVVAPDLTAAVAELRRFPTATAVELELGDDVGLADALEDGRIEGKRLTRVVVDSAERARTLLADDGDYEVVVQLSRAVEPWLLSLERTPPRLVLRQPTHDRLTDSAEQDVILPEFFSRLRITPPVENVPTCLIGRAERKRPPVLDGAMLTPEGRLEIFRYAKRYVIDRFWTKSLRCSTCRHEADCRGLHINYVRAHGYGCLEPIVDEQRARTAAPVAPAPAE